ncbi:hypothetical protein PG996_011683 [Apiospora saccharicola]|uniref:Uncharacterized protein n=1 Tax=Apiospora saccharicola TaxID=335842 RepID=A0ABR1UFR1_9PEZI
MNNEKAMQLPYSQGSDTPYTTTESYNENAKKLMGRSLHGIETFVSHPVGYAACVNFGRSHAIQSTSVNSPSLEGRGNPPISRFQDEHMPSSYAKLICQVASHRPIPPFSSIREDGIPNMLQPRERPQRSSSKQAPATRIHHTPLTPRGRGNGGGGSRCVVIRSPTSLTP